MDFDSHDGIMIPLSIIHKKGLKMDGNNVARLGHFTEDKNVTFANFADQLSFRMWQCAHPDFQLKK
ncbi:hypothetical protein LZD49_30660 [Dyadobacter sp. CY261]|uniref:hypothetical protein n=1 Tax=Dyadobacter sp. CY261 TaxID=2907203 RepID=UPI001F400C58|nr:hypothetical protein [Dyadobacter sp. CY261]MCF0074887.1 hypothetical protein [Dyadobacter sp. CY261]